MGSSFLGGNLSSLLILLSVEPAELSSGEVTDFPNSGGRVAALETFALRLILLLRLQVLPCQQTGLPSASAKACHASPQIALKRGSLTQSD